MCLDCVGLASAPRRAPSVPRHHDYLRSRPWCPVSVSLRDRVAFAVGLALLHMDDDATCASSAMLCAIDARTLYHAGDYTRAASRACKSLAYSVGSSADIDVYLYVQGAL